MQLFYKQFSWGDLLFIALILVGLYFLLNFIQRILPKIFPAQKIQRPVHKVLQNTLLVYEPIVFLILASVFVLINPFFHGLLLLLTLLVCFIPIRNYFSGRLVQLTNAISIGKKISTNAGEGVIAEAGRLGLKLRSNNGMYFIGYGTLLSDGFLVHSGEEIGGLYKIHIVPKALEENIDYGDQLQDLLFTAPYIDWNNQANTFSVTPNSSEYEVSLLVREDNHLNDLIILIEERGFNCTIQNS